MKKTNITLGKLDEALRSFGFESRSGKNNPPGRIIEHKNGAIVALPAFADDDCVYGHHVAAARWEVEDFGIADSKTFDYFLQKVS